MENKMNRRRFLETTSLLGGSLLFAPSFSIAGSLKSDVKPARLGGAKAHPKGFQSWPIYGRSEELALVNTLKTGKWGRLDGNTTATFETEYARMLGVKHSLGVSSGTAALYSMLGALNLGPGDEVIIPVYTFVATYNVVTLNYALPVFVDSDIETFQIDARKIEPAITSQTKVIMPVHIGGLPADLDTILNIGKKHNITIIEDACQAHLAEWRGKKVGSYGLGGAFSFQSSKNLNCAEGGAITSNNEEFIQRCYAFHNQGQGGARTSFAVGGEGTRGVNMRLTEFQSGLLLAQMSRLEEQARIRDKNASYLNKALSEIPGITPAKLYDGVTMGAYHLYMFRYDPSHFAGMSREKFLEALSEEGVPCSAGYGSMNKSEYVQKLAANKHYLKIYGEKAMKEWLERNECPQNDKLAEQGVWLLQYMLLGSREDMDQIVEAIRKIQKYAKQLNK
ncbi:DegT/DnrJ/EryC1/StrS family aminotransferase [Parabacteroides chinchillae]|uniref:dTDP-4-amino-4,6-dideoxygalactose transaminase n=1 Tax=Parabacteroides chinchillae TaxID=871327 RepID=A0A8G2F234_9BACT|nr:DegT/DnrJ/EryC1/StrS family aminotransferase [Parabacteroides chinchillae]SEG10788.1 dTDP-4-amino-4,6-dideoxygalactose transaminase [Parabacteroides chinchillae]